MLFNNLRKTQSTTFIGTISRAPDEMLLLCLVTSPLHLRVQIPPKSTLSNNKLARQVSCTFTLQIYEKSEMKANIAFHLLD